MTAPLSFEIEVSHSLPSVSQGLATSVPTAKRGSSVALDVSVGIRFAESQMDACGRFVDSDAVREILLREVAQWSRPWGSVFAFRPTYEAVARSLYRRLRSLLPQVAYVKIHDLSGVTVICRGEEP